MTNFRSATVGLDGREVLATLLRHEAKSNTYKFALVRALNDLALEFPWWPDQDVIVPLRRVAERWLVSYWPFVGEREVQQGARSLRDGVRRQDISFRAALTRLRLAWEALTYTRSHPADGALLLADHQAGRGRLSPELLTLTEQALTAITQAVKQPVKFAGPGDRRTRHDGQLPRGRAGAVRKLPARAVPR